MKHDRRQFIRDVSLTATALGITSNIGAAKTKADRKVISCGPEKVFELTATVSSVKSGNWSDAATWSGGNIPTSADTPSISAGHSVVFDLATATVAGVNVAASGTLSFSTTKSTTLQTTKNVVILGRLQMRPGSSAVVQTLRFTGINENNYVGGGMDVLASDIGLWVMGAGVLDLAGTTKTSWTNASGAISQGATSFTVAQATGWKTGDVISIAPTEPPTVGSAFAKGFDEGNITSISGTSVVISKATARPHPIVNGKWKAEVMNLTRNVNIEGTASGRAHIFIRSTSKQTIRFTAIRYMGPRKDRSGDSVKELVAGRYGLHFHHCMDASRGSIVEGNVIRDTNNHAYVPHVSHGITFLDNVSYNTLEAAFWYDPGDDTHEIVYDHNIVAICNYVVDSQNMNAEDAPTFSSSGFTLNTGDGNVCKNNVVVAGGMGDVADGAAYNWEAVINEGVWTFTNNIAHNNDCGIRIWQNSTLNHVIEDFIGYHNVLGVFHGAYANSYTYTGGTLYGNGFQVKAASVNSNRVRLENIIIDGAGIINHGIEVIHSPLPGEVPILARNLTIRNCKVAAVLDTNSPEIHSIDLVQCNITGAITLHSQAVAGETIRVQPPSGTPYKLTSAGKATIAAFAPTVWGTGKGLKAEYFTSANLTNLAFTRIDSNISFSEWNNKVHYKLGNTYSVRWTGKIMPQYSEAYTFHFSSGGGHRLWINNNLVLDSWSEKYPDLFKTSPITLVAGTLYDIKLEHFNTDTRKGAGLLWSSAKQQLEYVPQSQLYAGAITQPVAENKPPVANAGPDIIVTLPATTATLNATGSSDPEGATLKFLWSQVSGPSTATFSNTAVANTGVSALKEGTYVFRVKVTDDKGATAQDDVSVLVQSATATNKPPIASAGSDITITLPNNKTTLTGSASRDDDGTISLYQWTKVSGPTQFTLATPSTANTAVSNLVAGTYVFRLKVTDNKGASHQDDVSVIVKAAGNQTPVANAGNDVVITAPTRTATVNGTQSQDPDGTIAAYLWTKVSGPSLFKISSPSSSSTTITDLVPGVYVFRLTVTDNGGLKDTDDVTVTVKDSTNVTSATLTVTILPNPSTTTFSIRVTTTDSTTPIRIGCYNSSGVLIDQIVTVKGTNSFSVGSSWSKGTYYLVVEQGSLRKIMTMVKA